MTTTTLLSPTNFNDWQAAKAGEARRLIEATVNSTAFQDAVLAARFLDVRLERADGTTVSRLSNRQILDTILGGTERGTVADHVIGLRVSLYSKLWSSAIGWTDEEGVIHTRDRFFNSAEPVEIAGHWIHEWTHAAGFRHDFKNTSRRDHSVPYLIGELLVTHAAPFITA